VLSDLKINPDQIGFVEILTLFFSTLFLGYGTECLRPRRCGIPLSDDSREGTITQSQSAGAVRGDRHCPLRMAIRNVLKSLGFTFAKNIGC
jgi:hypothetical protein